MRADCGSRCFALAVKLTVRRRNLATRCIDEYAALAKAIESAEAEVDRFRRLIDETIARRRRPTTLERTDPGPGAA